jgi:hypothetical protein
MDFSKLRAMMPAVLVVGLAGVGRADTGTSGVKDNAELFTPAALETAKKEIAAIKQACVRDLLIETFKTAPPNRISELRGMDADARKGFFTDWSKKRMQRLHLKDIYVLFCKDPPYIEVTVGQEMLHRAFPAADRDHLRDLMLTHFRQKDYDTSLLKGVRFVRARLGRDPRAALPPPVINQVMDYAAFFSAGGLQRANALIRDINHDLNRSLVFETFPGVVQEDRSRRSLSMAGGSRRLLFDTWMEERASATGIDGLYVLICRRPGHVQVGAGRQTTNEAFRPGIRDNLRDLLISRFDERQFDLGLLESLALIYDSWHQAQSAAVSRPVTGEVTDHARLFDEMTIRRANQELRHIQIASGHRVLVETFKSVPPGKVKQVELMPAEERARFFAAWANERLEAAGGGTVGILICMDPMHVEVRADSSPGEGPYGSSDTTRLRDRLAEQLKAGRCDDMLASALDDLRSHLKPIAGQNAIDTGSDAGAASALPMPAGNQRKTDPVLGILGVPASSDYPPRWGWVENTGIALLALGVLMGVATALILRRQPGDGAFRANKLGAGASGSGPGDCGSSQVS